MTVAACKTQAGPAPVAAAAGASRNPLFNANHLKLGTFGTNGKGGAQTLVPEAYRATWPAALETARLADEAGFEAIVGYARWKGIVPYSTQHPSAAVLDPFTWSAGLAQATSHAAVIATTHAPTIHPIAAAKQCATVDIISNGRFGLNVVGGWNRPELEMFGASLREHDERYEYLEEWLAIVDRLWNEAEEFDHHGRFFDIVGGMSMPKPVQRPRPPIMNAGNSETGKRFAARHADLCLVSLPSPDPEACRKVIQSYKDIAREETGRDVQVWTYAAVVQRDTQKEAEDYLDYYAVENEDTACIEEWLAGIGAGSRGIPPETLRGMRKQYAAGGAGPCIVGTAERIADQLHSLSDAGLDGVLFTWVDFVDGLRRFTAEAMPLLETRGLRAPFVNAMP